MIGMQDELYGTAFTGHPSCPRGLDAIDKALEQSLTGVFMLPPITPSLTERAERIYTRAGASPEAELVLNDWGSLYRCSELKKTGRLAAKLTAGPLLSGQDTDPILTSFYRQRSGQNVYTEDGIACLVYAPPSSMLTELWRTPSIFHMTEELRAMEVSGIVLSPQPLPLPKEGPGLEVSLWKSAVVSVRPCCHDCAHCALPAVVRGGRGVYSERNLILCDILCAVPDYASRLLIRDYEAV